MQMAYIAHFDRNIQGFINGIVARMSLKYRKNAKKCQKKKNTLKDFAKRRKNLELIFKILAN